MMMTVNSIADLLLKHKGKRASVNMKESEHFGWMVVDVEPLKAPEKSVFIIEDVTEQLLILNYYDAKELHYIPLDKIIKVNVILRDR
jgi:hypothetical protein